MSDRQIISLNGTGTTWGISTYEQLMDCPKTYLLKHIYPEADTSSDAQRAGTYGHVLMANYHGRELSPYRDMVFGPDIGVSPQFTEINEAFAHYRNYISPDGLGTVVASEKLMPATEAEQALLAAHGIERLTGQPDLVVDMSDDVAMALSKQFGAFVYGGRWLVDFKFIARADRISVYERSSQFKFYPVLWNICNPTEPVEGMLGVYVMKYKASSKLSRVNLSVTPLKKTSVRHLQQWYQLAQRRFEEIEMGFSNPSKCYGVYTCAWAKNGLCHGDAATSEELNRFKETTNGKTT